MPDYPIIDAHVHLWNPERVRISWQHGHPTLERPFLVEDYREALGSVEVEAMVFVECFADPGEYLREVAFVEEQAASEPRLKAIVAQAPMELGEDAVPFLEALTRNHPAVRGIRRLIEFQPDPEFCLRPGFVRGVNLLADMGLSFDVNVHHSQMKEAAEFCSRVEDTVLVLDHCGKPPIAAGEMEPWRTHLNEIARNPNAHCKLSDLPVEADHESWKADDLRPYVDAVVEAFGFDRLIYAGDWPVCTQATTIERWVAFLDDHFSGVAETELRKLYRDNAARVYRLDA